MEMEIPSREMHQTVCVSPQAWALTGLQARVGDCGRGAGKPREDRSKPPLQLLAVLLPAAQRAINYQSYDQSSFRQT